MELVSHTARPSRTDTTAQNKAWSDLALDLYYCEVDAYSHLAVMLPDTVKRILTWVDDLVRLTVISMRVCRHSFFHSPRSG